MWTSIPKFISWEIWLARNKAIFQQSQILVVNSTNKACNLVSEVIQVKGMQGHNVALLEKGECYWMDVLINQTSLFSKKVMLSPPFGAKWKILIEDEEFLRQK
jgi:hypothetical protein